MILRLALKSILSLVLLSKAVPLFSVETFAQEAFSSVHEMQEFANCIAKAASETAESILSVPMDSQTYENTIEPWEHLQTQLSLSFKAFEENNPYSASAAQVVGDLHFFLAEVLSSLQLDEHLTRFSKRFLEELKGDFMQKAVVAHFLQNGWSAPMRSSPKSEQISLKLSNADLATTLAADMSEIDGVWIENLAEYDDAQGLYELLKNKYAHLIRLPSDNARRKSRGGLLFSNCRQIPDRNSRIVTIRFDRDGDDGRSGGSGRVGVDYSWGGREGPQWNGYAEVEVHDGRGNYVEGRVEKNDRGEGRAHVEGGRERD